MPAFLAEPTRWDALVTVDGDAALAATLKGLAETLPWFVERAFAEALGPIAGQFVADTGRRMLAFPGYAGERVGDSVASYVSDEVRLAATTPKRARSATRSRRPPAGSMPLPRASMRSPPASHRGLAKSQAGR